MTDVQAARTARLVRLQTSLCHADPISSEIIQGISVMVVAAFVLSVVAVIGAVISAWYTRRQAVFPEAVRGIEADRRHDELAIRLLRRSYRPACDVLPRSSVRCSVRPE